MRVLAFALLVAGVSACAAIAGLSDYADCSQGGCDDGGSVLALQPDAAHEASVDDSGHDATTVTGPVGQDDSSAQEASGLPSGDSSHDATMEAGVEAGDSGADTSIDDAADRDSGSGSGSDSGGPTCSASTCTNLCIPILLEAPCCKADGTCGCQARSPPSASCN